MHVQPNGLVVNDGATFFNGRGSGAVGELMGYVGFDRHRMRPFFDSRGRRSVLVNQGWRRDEKTGDLVPVVKKASIDALEARGVRSPVWNATTLTKDAWIEFDRAIVKARRQRLRAWTDLANSSSRGGFNAYAKATLEYQAMNDPGVAVVDMDGSTMGRDDRPLFDLKSVPLPITHSDFSFSDREIDISRSSGMPLDTTGVEAAARRVVETVEQTVIGTLAGITYGTNTAEHTGTSTVYGYTNFPYRVIKNDLTPPTGANPEAVMTDVLEMVETMQGNGFFGPYMLYHSTAYSRYFNDDYFRSGSTSAVRSLRERVMEIEGISDIRRLDYLTSGFQLLLIQMDSEVAQAINGMDITTVQWDTIGGLRKHFKIMAIMVPLLKTPYNGVSGILHGTTA